MDIIDSIERNSCERVLRLAGKFLVVGVFAITDAVDCAGVGGLVVQDAVVADA